jgi:hypothetical protein
LDSDSPAGTSSKAAVWGTLVGIVVTLPALFLAALSSGAGHGNYLFARALFPWPMLVTLDQEIGVPSLVMALAQFPVFGFVAGRAMAREKYGALIAIAALHIVGVALCFSGAIPNFS